MSPQDPAEFVDTAPPVRWTWPAWTYPQPVPTPNRQPSRLPPEPEPSSYALSCNRVVSHRIGIGVGGGPRQGWSPAKRMATPSSAYSRRTRWPSFFSMQTENPGYRDTPLLDVSSTSLSSTGEYPLRFRSIYPVS